MRHLQINTELRPDSSHSGVGAWTIWGCRGGDTVIFNGKRRFVTDIGKYCISFVKIGTSWTDPNPNATYDRYAVRRAGGLILVKIGTPDDIVRAKKLASYKNPYLLEKERQREQEERRKNRENRRRRVEAKARPCGGAARANPAHSSRKAQGRAKVA